MASWLFPDVDLEPGEQLVFRRVCTQRRGRRTGGGEVSVTDRRLVFVPNRLEQLARARVWEFARADIDTVEVRAPPGAGRFPALPFGPKARVQIVAGDQVLELQLTEALALAWALGHLDG